MRTYLLMGGLLMGWSALFVGPASGQEPMPSTAPPGSHPGLTAGSTTPMDALRMAQLAVMQAAAGVRMLP